MCVSVPLVSVIIPIYNVEMYLHQCLASVINQSYHRLDIICVIDGSEDNSEAIALEFSESDPRLRVIKQANQGLSVARNRGVQSAKGEFVFFLDSDDWLVESGLECLVDAALTHQGAVVSGAVINYDENSGTAKPYKKIKKRQIGSILLQRQTFFALETMVWNKLYRRDVVLATPFVPELIHEDLDFYWKAFASFPHVYAVPQNVIFYRRRSGSLSNSKSYNDSYQDNFMKIVDNAFAVVLIHKDLRNIFQRQALKYLEHLRRKNAPCTRYEAHINKKYGIYDDWLFKMLLDIRRFFERF